MLCLTRFCIIHPWLNAAIGPGCDYILYLITGLLLYSLLNDHSLHPMTICLQKVNQKWRDLMYEHVLNVAKFWKILQNLENPQGHFDASLWFRKFRKFGKFGLSCQILHFDVKFHTIMQNYTKFWNEVFPNGEISPQSGTYHFYHKLWAFACKGFCIVPSNIWYEMPRQGEWNVFHSHLVWYIS